MLTNLENKAIDIGDNLPELLAKTKAGAFVCPWNRRLQVVQTLIESRQRCTIKVEPEGPIKLNEAGFHSYERAKVTVAE